MSLKKSAINGVLWTAVRFWGGQGISLVVFTILARLVSPEEFGLLALANIFITFISTNLAAGFSEKIVQGKETESAKLNTLFYANICLGFLLTTLVFTLADPVGRLYENYDLAWVIKVLSPNIVLASLISIPEAILKQQLKFKLISLRTVIAGLFSGIVGVSMAVMGYGIWSLIFQATIYNLLEVVILWCGVDWKPGFELSRFSYLRNSLYFEFNMIGSRAFDFVSRRSADFLIALTLGTVALGYYTVAFKVVQALIMLLVVVISQVAFPTFSRISDNVDKLRNAYCQTLKAGITVTSSCFVAISVLSEELIQIFFGNQWNESVGSMRILSLLGVLYTVVFINRSTILALGKPNIRLIISLISTTISMLAVVVAASYGELIYVVIAFVAANYFVAIIETKIVQINLNLSMFEFSSVILPPILISGLLSLSIWVLNQVMKDGGLTSLYRIIFLVPFGAILWILLLFAIERSLFRAVFFQVKQKCFQ